MRNLWVILFLGISGSLAAQASVLIDPHNCAWRAGDNPKWADPNLDESGWAPMAAWGQGSPKYPGNRVLPPAARVWIRCHQALAAIRIVSEPAIQVRVLAAYQLFLNGRSIGASGNLANGIYTMNAIRSYPFVPTLLSGHPDVVALRLTFRAPQSLPILSAGDLAVLEAERAATLVSSVRGTLPFDIPSLVAGIIGLLQLGLLVYDRSRRDILWLGMSSTILGIISINNLCSSSLVEYSSQLYYAIIILFDLGFIFVPLFFFSLARRRFNVFVWILYAISQSGTVVLLVGWFATPETAIKCDPWSALGAGLRVVPAGALAVLALTPFYLFLPWSDIPRHFRSIVLCCFLWSASFFAYFAAWILSLTDWSQFLNRHFTQLWLTIVVTQCAAMLVLLYLLFRDQRRITEERAMLAGEFQAAREIQRVLAPTRIPTIPGLAIDVAFRPMRDVGGDFYLCRILADGRQRLLLGDVSGKGAAAAMTAALLLGGAEDHDDYSPGRLLSHLDRVLRESQVEGFATCLCADFCPGGRSTLANAGHLPPYTRGEEIPVESSLPLGLNGHIGHYGELEFSLDPGDTLTFLSDGVVEARSRTGELFGFDRTRALSSQSADQIAQAAEKFGQQDDITVLTLTFSGAASLQPG